MVTQRQIEKCAKSEVSQSVLVDKAAQPDGFSSLALEDSHWVSGPAAGHPSHCWRFVLPLTPGKYSTPKVASIQSHREKGHPLTPSHGMPEFFKTLLGSHLFVLRAVFISDLIHTQDVDDRGLFHDSSVLTSSQIPPSGNLRFGLSKPPKANVYQTTLIMPHPPPAPK